MDTERNAWLIWTKNRTWRLYVPRSPHRRPIPTYAAFGSNRMSVPVTQTARMTGEYSFPVSLTRSGKTWKLSPLLGILTSKRSGNAGFRGNYANFADIIQTGRRMGVPVFVFTADSLNEGNPTISGFTRHPSTKQWIRCVFPWPDVVYNRIPDREAEKRKSEQHALRWIASQPHMRMFNPHFFDKLQLFRWIERDGELRRFLPFTEPWGTKEQLAQLLERYPVLYIKPAQGKAGKGIMQVQKKGEAYTLAYVTGRASELKQYRAARLDPLYAKITQLIGSEPYLIQQAVSLARYNGRPFDLRLLVQKDRSGSWGVTGIGVRIAGAGKITTHVPRGGNIGDVKKVLPRAFGSLANHVYQRAVTNAQLIADRIERQCGEKLGEMSLDLGVDQHLRFWLFEANAKPMKFDEPHIRKRSLEKIIEYTYYLAGRRNGLGRSGNSA